MHFLNYTTCTTNYELLYLLLIPSLLLHPTNTNINIKKYTYIKTCT